MTESPVPGPAAETEPTPFVLVVEDDDHIGGLLVFMLQRQGCNVKLCTDGRAAREFIETSTDLPKLILLDVMLPYHDGVELLGLVRGRPDWQGVRVVMLTAKTTQHDIARALASGASDYIVKPFEPVELIQRLRHMLDLNRLE
jgi:DNA-binding response OmpR family regulator